MSGRLTTVDARWVCGQAPEPHLSLGFKTRYRQPDARGHLVRPGCGLAGTAEGFSVVFDESQWAVTPGQSVVVYDQEVCLGGGIIA